MRNLRGSSGTSKHDDDDDDDDGDDGDDAIAAADDDVEDEDYEDDDDDDDIPIISMIKSCFQSNRVFAVLHLDVCRARQRLEISLHCV